MAVSAHFYPEIIHPESLNVLPDGDKGELVFTSLIKEAMPIIRYRTRDLSRAISVACPCGRTHRRIERIKGRSDDMLIIRGVNVFPSQVEHALMKVKGVGTNYQIHLDRVGGLDRMTVKIEPAREAFHGDVADLETLRNTCLREVQSVILIRPVIELVEPGTLPPSTGKAKRVFDVRAL